MHRTRAAANHVLAWREPVSRHLPEGPVTLLDVGAGTGVFATAFADWFDPPAGTPGGSPGDSPVGILAVEPSAAGRAEVPLHPRIRVIDGHPEALPLPAACADLAWLSRITHRTRDLGTLARELHRTMRPGAPLLIREVFPERCARRPLVRFFPECRRVINAYPTLERTRAAFAAAGFRDRALHPVAEWAAADLAHFTGGLRRGSNALLRGLSDEEYARGLCRLRGAAPETPVLDHIDLLVLTR
ncbi:methyltransferase domain-containing protein [Streptomyces sp. 21So2-11]|uniref:class I SAM-dependent methyltransferase n=1 Tax=Streptomyces sp. 21So2-11 TaxID=3144408 RepID=UPI00321A47B8